MDKSIGHGFYFAVNVRNTGVNTFQTVIACALLVIVNGIDRYPLGVFGLHQILLHLGSNESFQGITVFTFFMALIFAFLVADIIIVFIPVSPRATIGRHKTTAITTVRFARQQIAF